MRSDYPRAVVKSYIIAMMAFARICKPMLVLVSLCSSTKAYLSACFSASMPNPADTRLWLASAGLPTKSAPLGAASSPRFIVGSMRSAELPCSKRYLTSARLRLASAGFPTN